MDRADTKGMGDFVSRADVEAQEAALGLILDRHPDHAVMAEEDDPDPATAADTVDRPVWVVDPLDGTTNFLHGHPLYAASVAVAVEGQPVAGAIVCPFTGERWWATRGGGAWKNGRPIRVSGLRDLKDALLGTGFPFKTLHQMEQYLAQMAAFLRRGAAVRRGGAAALDLAYVAEGRFDGFWELFLNPWDFAAGVLLIEEAGGVVVDREGGPLRLERGALLAANGPELLERITEVLDAADAGEG